MLGLPCPLRKLSPTISQPYTQAPLQAPILCVTHPQRACPLSPAESQPKEGHQVPERKSEDRTRGRSRAPSSGACPLPQRCKFQNPKTLEKTEAQKGEAFWPRSHR